MVDEAYADFSEEDTCLSLLSRYPNLVVLQTFSKAWGMAGIRLGMAFAPAPVSEILNRIKYPYNLNILTQQKALELLNKKDEVQKWVSQLVSERIKMEEQLTHFPFVEKVFPSDANFLLVKMHDANGIYDYLVEEGIIVRNRSMVHLCDNSLRITIGSPKENETLLDTLSQLI